MAHRAGPRPEVERLRALTVSAIAISIVGGAAVAETASPAVGLALIAAAVVVGGAAILDGRSKPDEAGPPLVRVLGYEIERARRHGHALSLVRAVPAAGLTLAEVRDRIRVLDHAWLDDREVVLLLGETDRDGATRLVTRLTTERVVSSCSVAAFPEDALTTGGLLARLEPGRDVVHLAPSPSPAPAASAAANLTSVDGGARTG